MSAQTKALLLIVLLLTLASVAPCSSKEAQEIARRGSAKQEKGDFDGAIADYTKALQLDPDQVTVYINRGVAKMAKRDFDGTIADCTEAIRGLTQLSQRYSADPSAPIQGSGFTNQQALDGLAAFEVLAYFNRGMAEQAKEDWDGAIADYAKVYELRHSAFRSLRRDVLGIIKITPDLAFAYYARGVTKASKGDSDGAIADFTTAIQIKPDFAEAYYNRGSVRGNKGDKEGVKADHAKAFELKPDLAK